MLDITHECNAYACCHEVEECYCEGHFEEKIEKANKEGYEEGFKEGQESME